MKDSIKSIQTEQNKKEEEMKSKLEERDKQLNAAKVRWLSICAADTNMFSKDTLCDDNKLNTVVLALFCNVLLNTNG